MKIDDAILFGLLFVCGVLIGLAIANNHYHSKAIEHNCAQYNSTTGEFEWMDVAPIVK